MPVSWFCPVVLRSGAQAFAGSYVLGRSLPAPKEEGVILLYELLILSPGPFPPDSLASSGCV